MRQSITNLEQIKSFEEYLLAGRGYSQHTAESYLRAVRYLYQYLDVSIEKASVQDLREALHSILQERDVKISASSQQQLLSAWVHFFDFLRLRGLLEINPAKKLERPRSSASKPKWVPESDIEKLLTACGKSSAFELQLRAMIYILYAGGLRISELLALRMKDVSVSDDHTVIVEGKGGKQRVVPLGVAAYTELRRYLEHGRRALNPYGSDYLFPSVRVKGKPLSRQAVFKWLKNLSTPLGIEISAHGFRHSCATHMLAHGAALPHIQHQLGHSHLQTTEIYTDVLDDTLREALESNHPLSTACTES